MPSFNRKKTTGPSTATASSLSRTRYVEERQTEIDNENNVNPATPLQIVNCQPFVWTIRSAQSVKEGEVPTYRRLKPPQVESYTLSSSLTLPTKSSASKHNDNKNNDKNTGDSDDGDDNALLNIINFRPPVGTPPIIFDPNNITEVKPLPPVPLDNYSYLGKKLQNVKSSYFKLNPKHRAVLKLSSNSKKRQVVQNEIYKRHPSTSLDPSNLPTHQTAGETNWSKYFKKGSKIREQW